MKDSNEKSISPVIELLAAWVQGKKEVTTEQLNLMMQFGFVEYNSAGEVVSTPNGLQTLRELELIK